jgi:cell division septal protein FtsQ
MQSKCLSGHGSFCRIIATKEAMAKFSTGPSKRQRVLDIKKTTASREKARDEMRPLFSQKPTRLRTRRRNRRILVSCICMLSAAGFVGALGAVSHLEQLAINDVSVTGAAAIQSEALTASVQAGLENDGFNLFSKENMFLYPKRLIEEKLATEFPRIKDVTLARPSMLAQAVVVAVEERTSYAKWCDEKCYLIDASGFVFAEAANETPEIGYQFRGGLADDRTPIGQWFLRGRLPGMVQFLQHLAAAGFTPVLLTVDTEKDFTVTLDTGLALYMPFDADTETLLRNLKTTIESDSLKDRVDALHYIDLRFGNRVYYK